MKAETARLLREPFAAELVGKLPRVTCRPCRDSPTKACGEHRKARCRECGNFISSAHMHLDYVGHAEITDRLLSADPAWTWEPVASGPEGLPLLDRNGGLWIRLTVAGVTRLGYGHADGKSGPDAIKEAIGDALRNAAMRFGVALDLWGAKFKDTDDQPEPEPAESDAEQVRQNILTNAKRAISKAADADAVDAIQARISECETAERITGQDAIDLRRLVVARLDELFPAAEQAALEGDWPNTANPGGETA